MKRLAVVFLAAALTPVFAAAAPVRVLIVTGQSDTQYHDWRITTPFYKHVLDTTGRFDVRVLEDPRGLSRDVLANYDVVVVNYNGPRWGAGPEAALEEFVRSGKGLVSIHGVTYGPLMGTLLQPDGKWKVEPAWAGWKQMHGVDWAGADIGHAPRHAFEVKTSPHPITNGLASGFTVNDELYHKQSHQPGIQVIAAAYDDPARGGTGKNEPVAWTNTFGKGRVYHCTLGHDTSAAYEPSAMAMFARATEWAATGQVTTPAHIAFDDPPKDATRVLVVTGGHAYDTSFYGVFASNPRIRWSHATSQREAFQPGMKERADVVVLYDMYNEIGEPAKAALKEYVEAGGGIVALHHSIVDYTSWPWWYEEVIGGKYFEKPVEGHPASHYKDDVAMVLVPVKSQENHPIIRGLGELTTVDECYSGMWHSPKITTLMEVHNGCNDAPVVYLGPKPDGRVVYIQLGHGTYTHEHPGYRQLVANAIEWAARK